MLSVLLPESFLVVTCPLSEALYTAKAASAISPEVRSTPAHPDDITRLLFYCDSILSKKPNSVNTILHQKYKNPNIIL